MFSAENVFLTETDKGYNSEASNNLNNLQCMYWQNVAVLI